jgi:CBS domain-containing protein
MYTVKTETTIEQCLRLMDLRHIRHLPIVEEGRLMGIISMRDAIAAVLKGHEEEIQGIEKYALSSGFQG